MTPPQADGVFKNHNKCFCSCRCDNFLFGPLIQLGIDSNLGRVTLFNMTQWLELWVPNKRDKEMKDYIDIYNNKILDGTYKIEHISCLCGADNYLNLAKKDRYGLWNHIVLCKNCGLIYANPRLTKKSYEHFYSSDEYRTIYEGTANYLHSASLRYSNKQGMHIFDTLKPYIVQRNLDKIFEFGCGGGWNLVHFPENDFTVSGCDYSPGMVELGRARGLNLNVGSLDTLTGRYDVIILNHVVEHFTNIFNSLRTLSNCLNIGGLFYIGVPNMDNFGLGQFQNAHTYYFSPRTFINYMAEAGLKCIEQGAATGSHMYGIFEVTVKKVNTNISLSNEYKRMTRLFIYARIKSLVIKMLDSVGLSQAMRKLKRTITN